MNYNSIIVRFGEMSTKGHNKKDFIFSLARSIRENLKPFEDKYSMVVRHEFLENSGYYSICFFDSKYKKDLVYLGTNSGRDGDKISKTKLTIINDGLAPYFKEANLVIFCRKIYRDDFKKENFIDKSIIDNIYYEKGAKLHTMYIGKIEKVIEQDE